MKNFSTWWQAAKQLADGQPDQAVLSKALRQAKGDKNDAWIRYINFRAAILSEENRKMRRAERWAKVESFAAQQVRLLLFVALFLFVLFVLVGVLAK